MPGRAAYQAERAALPNALEKGALPICAGHRVELTLRPRMVGTLHSKWPRSRYRDRC